MTPISTPTPRLLTFSVSLRLCVSVLMGWSVALLTPLLIHQPCYSADLTETDVFTAGAEGYHTYRIPALLTTKKGTLLAICEGRKTGRGDHGDVDLVQKRSTDGGKTWGPVELIHEQGGTAKVTIGNPCPVVDQDTGVIWFPFNRENDSVLMMSSSDDGRTWTKPRDITTEVKKPDWTWYATGPGNGIQLTRGKYKGRLVIPCDHRVGDAKPSDKGNWDKAGRSHVIYSDDRGQTWKLGGATDYSMNECAVVELTDGTLMLNSRSYRGKACRGISLSKDGGESWGPTTDDPALVESVCQASLIRYSTLARSASEELLIFSNPAVPRGRNHLTVRASADEGKSWPHSRLLCEGSSAYSSLAVLPSNEIGLLYERDDYKRIVFARFSPTWIRKDGD